MRRVIVVNENGVTVRIIRPRVSPIERTADHDGGEHNGQPPLQQTTARRTRPHPPRLYPRGIAVSTQSGEARWAFERRCHRERPHR